MMLRRLRTPALAAFFIATFQALTSNAQGAGPPPGGNSVSPGSTELARRQSYERAHAAFAQGDFSEAHRIFAELWAERPTYDIAGFLGQTEIQLKLYRDAAEHIAFSLQNWPPRERLELLAQVKEGLAVAKRHIGSLWLFIEPPGARIAVDGKSVGTSPLASEVYVEPGARTVTVELEGYEPVTRTVEFDAGQEQALNLQLTQKAEPRAAPEPSSAPIAPLTPTLESDASANASQSSRPSPALLVFGGAAILAGTTAGALFAINANAAGDDLSRLRGTVGPGGCRSGSRPECAELLEAAESKDRSTNASYLMFGIAGGAAAFTIGYYLWPRSSTQHQSAQTGAPNGSPQAPSPQAPSAQARSARPRGAARISNLSMTWLPEGGAFAGFGGTL